MQAVGQSLSARMALTKDAMKLPWPKALRRVSRTDSRVISMTMVSLKYGRPAEHKGSRGASWVVGFAWFQWTLNMTVPRVCAEAVAAFKAG